MADPESTILNTSVNQKDAKEALVIAVTTRAIFNLEKEHEIFLTKGKDEYLKHQQMNENNPLEQGTAFAFVQAVQFVNKQLLERNPEEKRLFDVIVLSNNSPESGLRIINSAKHHGLEISKFCFVSDEDSTQYLKTHNVKLFLSADRKDVRNALQRGVSAALIFQQEIQTPNTQLRVVFDGDAVLFSDETERVFREEGLEGAIKYEKHMENVPMGEGPLKTFALHLGKMRKMFDQGDSPIRTYLVTARSGRDMGIRAIKTLREWGLAIDEAFFMDGAPKGPILSKIQPHIFFDDGLHNIQGARDVGIPSALVPWDC
ncbi:cytosolic 5'-nucleotidase 1A-like [Hemicordylus capensis]|uniref:cytosolic 5'-nucleotidase 1A-like n=1 Tax=Hemicordylus capensis TaxID=884348 RepID=UPI0023042112|nr:cytosolic 5'-nucleotidase 1A-like [Hemicordylus capensis]XP_053108173.1 cytosolic 5'-nucleotidase 1A-like [Hemicordylus capensis]XP_053108180.1 cytosolic 5'-nucleotidase 1A-like [Hemicordylus capensis]